jgi:hypothetical protein
MLIPKRVGAERSIQGLLPRLGGYRRAHKRHEEPPMREP